MRRLLLLRHAKSDWSVPGQTDHERLLSQRGEDAAPLMGAYMAREGLVPERAIVSSAARTRETWRLLSQAFANPPPATFDDRIYEAEPEEILAAIAEVPANVNKLLVVGHNPGFQDTASLLTGSGDKPSRALMAAKFPTAALAVIDFDCADWSALAPHTGRLDRFVTPRAIASQPD